jgi:hypothetical protein
VGLVFALPKLAGDTNFGFGFSLVRERQKWQQREEALGAWGWPDLVLGSVVSMAGAGSPAEERARGGVVIDDPPPVAWGWPDLSSPGRWGGSRPPPVAGSFFFR